MVKEKRKKRSGNKKYVENKIELEFYPVKKEPLTNRQMSQYEYAHLIHSLCISMIASQSVPPEYPPYMSITEIAQREIDKKASTLVVQREVNGKTEYCDLSELILPR